MRAPDFFIVGAPKCGTTAMGEYLKQHPEIFLPERKEINFFGSDLRFSFPRVTREQYLAYFATATQEKRLGEAAVWYLYSQQAAAEIKNFCSSSQIVIMLRNPIDVMYALYHQRLYNGNEDIEDFTTALAAEEDRKRGSRLPKRATNVMGCFYRDNVKFTPQVQRYLEVFGRENVHIIIFDDLKNGMARVYRDCCAFLGVARNFQADFHVINPRKRVRSTLLRDLLHQPPPAVGWLWRALGLRLTHRGGYNGWLKRLNTTQANIPPMEPQLRRQLQEEFLPEVEQLSRLLDRDLTHWCTS